MNAVKFTPPLGGPIIVSMCRVEGVAMNAPNPSPSQEPELSAVRPASTDFPITIDGNETHSHHLPCDSNTSYESSHVLHPQRLSGCVLFEITDRGCGIPEHVRTQIFGEFFQFDPDRLQGGGGSGMGLWISREIIRRHGGDITFRPGEDGVGTVFSFRLPLYVRSKHSKKYIGSGSGPCNYTAYAEERADVADNLLHDEKMYSAPKGRVPVNCLVHSSKHPDYGDVIALDRMRWNSVRRVLIVDDSDFNRRIVRKLVTKAAKTICEIASKECCHCSLEISEADDGENAVELVLSAAQQDIPFDFVFMDNIMLRMNGPEAAQLMRKNGFKGRIIGVTGNVLPEDMQAFVDSGADRVLPKPVGVEQIKKELEE